MECTDDKTLPKMERKRRQITNAPKKSKEARLVKLADKLHNCRDFQRHGRKDWSLGRIQGYFRWAKQVTDQYKGTNARLEQALQDLFDGQFEFDGKKYDCVVKEDVEKWKHRRLESDDWGIENSV